MKVNTDKNCNIVIHDDTEYPVNGLSYNNSISLFVAILNKCDSQEIIYNKLVSHDNKNPIVLEEASYGFISIYQFIFPLFESTGYFSDGQKVYFKNTNGSIREVSTEELLEVNENNLTKFTYNFFSVCNLRKCYVALCQKIFNDRAFDRCFDSKVDSSLIYRRDLVWAALNVIDYLIDSQQYCEAQRLYQKVTQCNGLCNKSELGTKGCGCQ